MKIGLYSTQAQGSVQSKLVGEIEIPDKVIEAAALVETFLKEYPDGTILHGVKRAYVR